MSGFLDKIVSVDISLETVVASSVSYSSLLIVCPAPTDEASMPDIVQIGAAADLTEYGYQSSDAAYEAALVAFSQSPAPEAIYVAKRKAEEDLEDVLDKVNSTSWYGVALAGSNELTDIETAIKWAEANKKLFGYTTHSKTREVSLEGYYRSFEVYADKVEDDSTCDYVALAMMAKCFGYEPGSETWALKPLAAVPASELTLTEMTALDKQGTSYYVKADGISVTQGGQVMAGEWIDVIRFRDYLEDDIRSRVFNYFVANKKISYTDKGITGIQGQVIAAMKNGQSVGGIAPMEYDESGNEIPGYTVTVPRAYQIDKATKKSRKLPNVKFTARLAGAIQAVEVSGTLQN